jgi:hypothetical protein
MRISGAASRFFAYGWLRKQLFGYGFWRGFGVGIFLTPIFMTLISFAWNGNIPGWSEQFKSFIIGDSLLAGIIGLLAYLHQKPASNEYKPANTYWHRWLLVGITASVLFIYQELHKHVLHVTMLLQPHIFYHHILLITFYVSMLSGTTYVQYRRHPKSLVWIGIGLLFAGYVGLVMLDTVHPPTGVVHYRSA